MDRDDSGGTWAGHALNALCALHPALIERRIGEALARNVPRQLRAVHAPGAQFALAVGDRPCVGWSFGEARQGLAMDPRRSFRVASLSKPVSAFVVLRLVETAGLDLDEPLDRHLADIAGLPGGVTLRLLLSHRAGLRDCTSPLVAAGAVATMDDVLAGRLGEQHVPCFAAPMGASTQYTSAGYMLLQVALERLTGRGFADLARRWCSSRWVWATAGSSRRPRGSSAWNTTRRGVHSRTCARRAWRRRACGARRAILSGWVER
jgi:CubicO group peptidase (beta-lactamase class C family)